MSMRARISGTGMCVPDRVVTNADLEKRMDTTDEWIRKRSGIEERRHVRDGETPADLAEGAARAALESAGLEPSDVDCIVLATLSAQADFPGTSFFLQDRLDLGETPCFDVRAQCTGFLYSLSIASSFVKAGQFQRVLVVGAEVHSTGLDYSDRGRSVSVLFGDGAGALVVERNDDAENPGEILEIRLHAEGKHAEKLWVQAPGCGLPGRLTHEMLDQGLQFPVMDGKFVFKHAVTRMPQVLLETLNAASLKLEDVDLFLFHQANLRINEYVANSLELPPEKMRNNIQRYGNCSAGAIPMLLAEAHRAGDLTSGSLLSMTGFGSGFSWGSAVVRW